MEALELHAPRAGGGGEPGLLWFPTVGPCDGADGEDGVAFTSGLVQGGPASLEVTASAEGLLDAWIDWNADGDWDDVGEQVLTSESLSAGMNSLSVSVPAGAATGTTFARFRLSTDGSLAPTGFAADGEVEDYPVTVLDATFRSDVVGTKEATGGDLTRGGTVRAPDSRSPRGGEGCMSLVESAMLPTFRTFSARLSA